MPIENWTVSTETFHYIKIIVSSISLLIVLAVYIYYSKHK